MPFSTSIEVLRRVVASAPIGCIVWQLVDPSDEASLRLVLANAAAARYLSTTPAELEARLGRSFTDVFPLVPLDRRTHYADLIRKGATYEATTTSPVSGEEQTYRVKAIPIGESCIAIYFESMDVLRRAEAAALEANRFLGAIVENIPNMIFVKDAAELRFERFNKAGEELLGVTRDQLIGKNDYDFFPKEQADFFIAADRETLAGGKVKDIPEEPIQTAAGQRWLHTMKVPILDAAGKPQHLLGISEDITDRRRAEVEIRVAKEAAEVANRELEAFSYSVAHDLRAPLRAIDGFSQALVEDHAAVLPADAQQFLDRIRRGASRMGELIDDLLQLSRVTRAELRRTSVDLSRIAEDVVTSLRAAHAGREIETVIAPELSVSGDARLLRIVLENLLGNAFKFTGKMERARIELGADRKNDERCYFVRDDGVGFDMAHAARLFQAFQRLHGQNEFDGTGIGLAIVNRIVHRHGGRIWAESARDAGATFYFTLGQEA